MVIPVSSLTFLVISSDWLTAVPRYRNTFSSCDHTAGNPVIAPEPAAAPARPAAPFSTARRDRPVVLFVFFDIFFSLLSSSPPASRRRGQRVNVLVGPENGNVVADVERIVGELLVAHHRHKLARTRPIERHLVMRALIFDGAHRGGEPPIVCARAIAAAQGDAVGAHRHGSRRRLDHVVPAKEPSDEFGGRFFEELARRGCLLDAALVHHDDEVGERKGLVLPVRDMDEGY